MCDDAKVYDNAHIFGNTHIFEEGGRKMKEYIIKVTIEYYMEVRAKNKKAALEIAEDYRYDNLNGTQSFTYEVIDKEDD